MNTGTRLTASGALNHVRTLEWSSTGSCSTSLVPASNVFHEAFSLAKSGWVGQVQMASPLRLNACRRRGRSKVQSASAGAAHRHVTLASYLLAASAFSSSFASAFRW